MPWILSQLFMAKEILNKSYLFDELSLTRTRSLISQLVKKQSTGLNSLPYFLARKKTVHWTVFLLLDFNTTIKI